MLGICLLTVGGLKLLPRHGPSQGSFRGRAELAPWPSTPNRRRINSKSPRSQVERRRTPSSAIVPDPTTLVRCLAVSSKQQEIVHRVTIDAAYETVFDLVSDVARWPQFHLSAVH